MKTDTRRLGLRIHICYHAVNANQNLDQLMILIRKSFVYTQICTSLIQVGLVINLIKSMQPLYVEELICLI